MLKVKNKVKHDFEFEFEQHPPVEEAADVMTLISFPCNS